MMKYLICIPACHVTIDCPLTVNMNIKFNPLGDFK